MPRVWLATLTALVIVPWLITWASSVSFSTGHAAVPAVATDASVTAMNPGPWGRLVTSSIVISPPIEYVAADMGPIQPPVWYFPGHRPESVREFLAGNGLSADQVARATAASRFEPRINGTIVAPDAGLVRGLSPDVRARLYSALARNPLNVDQQQAYRFFGATTDDWLRGSPIAPSTRQLIEPLMYRVGNLQFFADIESVRAEISSVPELQRLVKTLVRQSTLLVRLDDIELEQVPALAEYWGRGGRRLDIRPLLESVATRGDQRSIDIVHLLPALPRGELYRYPRQTSADLARPVIANCLWTALNFFALQPDDKYLDVNVALKTLEKDYFLVEDNFQLGDIVALVDEDGDLFHVAVYLADGLLFSKNGMSPMAPWIITTLDALKGYYSTHSAAPHVLYHRRNDL